MTWKAQNKKARREERRKALAVAPVSVLQKAEAAVEKKDGHREKKRLETHPRRVDKPIVDRYEERGVLTKAQAGALRRLYADWYASGLDPWAINYGEKVSGTAGGAPGCGEGYLSYTLALKSLSASLRPVVVHVACHGFSAESWAKNAGVPASDGIAGLRFGSGDLADYYRKASQEALAV